MYPQTPGLRAEKPAETIAIMKFNIDKVKTERLHIRKLEMEDARSVFEIFTDPEVTRY